MSPFCSGGCQSGFGARRSSSGRPETLRRSGGPEISQSAGILLSGWRRHVADGSGDSGMCAVLGRARRRPVEGLLLRCPTHGVLGNFEEMFVRNIGAVETLVANADEQGEDVVHRAAAQSDDSGQARPRVVSGAMTGNAASGPVLCKGDSIHRFDAERSGKCRRRDHDCRYVCCNSGIGVCLTQWSFAIPTMRVGR